MNTRGEGVLKVCVEERGDDIGDGGEKEVSLCASGEDSVVVYAGAENLKPF